ncbi:hypothetical protein [Roseibium sp. Sym1]|uniref:hypothetical protein n=1 Tax=Roseibium sp. Sym1 TaxID=3016006 RepID=UPI0022B4CC3B|nr:hypothetical protein [Roseibium sp. Sym1]
MASNQPLPPSPVAPETGSPDGTGWSIRMKRVIRKWLSARRLPRQALPHDLLADVLADNGLRAREEECRQPRISGPWNRC